MNNELMEELLNEDESATLDFKRDPYPFDHATDEQKSELLKDILAFTNAWRRTNAYILIGVDDVKGGRSVLVGTTNHPDESKIQQFVNSKINRPIEFSYSVYPFESTQVGVIEIPVQERPVFLNKDYGRLKKNTVYLRRGSSTALAAPDEIARMGVPTAAVSQVPALSLQFAKPESQVVYGTNLNVISKVLYLPEPSKIPLIQEEYHHPLAVPDPLNRLNTKYYREYAQYLADQILYEPVQLILTNIGQILINDAHLEIHIAIEKDFYIKEEGELLRVPTKTSNEIKLRNILSLGSRSNTSIVERDQDWHLSVNFGNVQPKATAQSDKFYIGSRIRQNININAFIYADNLSDPVQVALTIHFQIEEGHLSVEKLKEIADKS